MSHKDYKEVEDFLIDDTFQQYCAQENEQCVQYWERYIQQHPEQQDVIARAQRVFAVLTGHKKPVIQQMDNLRDTINQQNKLQPIRRWGKVATYTAVAAALTLFGFMYLGYFKTPEPPIEDLAMSATGQVYQTIKGEKKTFTLEDGTTVTLNSESKLEIDTDFGKATRQVSLTGEAYLDVKKDADKPFVLHTNEFDIRVLGTSFNVKAYPDELASEALLIEGLIELKSKGKNENSIVIKPNQKVTIYKNELIASAETEAKKTIKPKANVKEIAIQDMPNDEKNEVADIAWKENRLAMVDQDFNELKSILERWYDIRITLKGPAIGKYRFTATFKEEDINQVLKALQKVEPFNYEIHGKDVIIYEK
ncbi:FecR family protein [Sphingobacterium yanglingense]|uniref:FecR family protein n=1 Tax=Sphingobacterium yanglingense TaxID=1437280 RepID=A0A4R6WHJ0_9SPHI|nr:FecR domain-containing protein [Sphingobacterium yanglingense]TDQ79653.1 FecR family protein [Sphingobacterium yanglingense]